MNDDIHIDKQSSKMDDLDRAEKMKINTEQKLVHLREKERDASKHVLSFSWATFCTYILLN